MKNIKFITFVVVHGIELKVRLLWFPLILFQNLTE